MIEKGQRAVFRVGCAIESNPMNYKGRDLARLACLTCGKCYIVSERETVESAVGGMVESCNTIIETAAPEGHYLDSVVRSDGSYGLIAVRAELGAEVAAE